MITFLNPGGPAVPRRPGRPRNRSVHLLALEYILWPGKRPYGLQKQLAHANNVEPRQLNGAITRIKSRVKEDV
jgi:hypothetical protein